MYCSTFVMYCSTLFREKLPKVGFQRYAFAGCTALVEVILHEGIWTIHKSAFSKCSSLLRINIPATVTTIHAKAFKLCTSLVEVVLHEGFRSINNWAFGQCSSLFHIDIPRSVDTIGLGAFDGCGVTILVGRYKHEKNAYDNYQYRKFSYWVNCQPHYYNMWGQKRKLQWGITGNITVLLSCSNCY